MAGERLLRLMKEATAVPDNEVAQIVVGTVTSTSPLKVKIDKLELTEDFIIVSAFCKEMKFTEASMVGTMHHHEGAHGYTSDAEIGQFEFTMWNAVEVGDDVILFKMNKGQKYFMLQPVQGVKTE